MVVDEDVVEVLAEKAVVAEIRSLAALTRWLHTQPQANIFLQPFTSLPFLCTSPEIQNIASQSLFDVLVTRHHG